MNNSRLKWVIILVALVVILFAGYRYLTMPDQRSATEHIGDAINALPQGADKAGQQLEDRTPGQKLGDEIKDATKPNSN